MNTKNPTKSAFVAIVGKPNVGKSSLLNALIGQKIAIVSNKPQTTRNRITGILTQDEVQLVFMDTPGLHYPKTKLNEYMIRQINSSVLDVDIGILVVDATTKVISKLELEIIEKLKISNIPTILVINKIDLLPRKELIIEVINLYSKQYQFASIVPVSVHKEDGLKILMEEIKKLTKEGPHFFAEDSVTDQMEKVIVAEIVREKILRNLNEEIPHGVAIVVESMKERKSGHIMDINIMIYCEKESHKGIIIGKSGITLKRIATQAREDIERFLQNKINLQCWVKVKDDWRNKINQMKNFGYTD